MNICPECARELPTTAKFCPFDGTQLNVPESKDEDPVTRETSASPPSPSTANMLEKLDENARIPTAEVASRVPTPPEKAKKESIKLSSEAPTVEEIPSVAPGEPSEDEGALGEDELDRFSETSWFMAASTIEKLDTEADQVSVDDEKYRPDSALEDEIRKKFSLRESGDGE